MKKGNLVMDFWPIFRHYLRTWFFIDLVASIPYSWFFGEDHPDFWPDDGFDEIEEIEGEHIFTGSNYNMLRIRFAKLETARTHFVPAISGFTFELPQMLRLMKLFRFFAIAKITQFFKIRKVIYQVRSFPS